MSNEFYKLDGKTPVPIDSMSELGPMFTDPKARVVRQTHFSDGRKLSTVFLVIDHGSTQDAEPILFETMVFGGSYGDEVLARYSTWDEAEKDHIQIVKHMHSDGAKVIKAEWKPYSIEDELETSRFELMDFE